ncbi:MAG: T9SS type A sorting domain-containing protein [Bacteroidales bacterium]|nr:T9SS type A sorting domain-containing protein [Bacteroidales bacterium]
MRKTVLFLVIALFANLAYTQVWHDDADISRRNRKKTTNNFYEIQRNFNGFWEGQNIDRGFRYVDGAKKKAVGWKQFKRWEWFWETRVDFLTGDFPQTNIWLEQLNYTNINSEEADQSNWVSLGPSSSAGGYAGIGRINCITFHPTNNNIIWTGAPSGGLWKTTDGGTSWQILTDNLPILGVSDIILADDYTTSNTIYIATGDRDGRDNYSVGVLKSTDDGVSWRSTGLSYNLGDGAIITRLLGYPGNTDILYACLNGILTKSTDAASSWTVLAQGYFYDMEFKPNCEDTVLYAARRNLSNLNIELIKTSDAGSNWRVVHTFSSSTRRVELAVSEADSTFVYALAANNLGGLEGVYKSTNSGESFSQVYDGSVVGNNLLNWYSGPNDSETGGQGWYDLTLAVAPNNPNVLYLGGINTWKSTDGGTSWTLTSHWHAQGMSIPAVHADKHSMVYQSADVFFEGNDGGIYKTTDGGATWIDLTNEMVISQMYKLGVSQIVADEVITGLQDNGSKLHSGTTWTDVKSGDGMECIIDYSDINTQYATYVYGQIDRTTDHWTSQTNITENIPGNLKGAWVTPYFLNPLNPNILYVGYADVWRSNNKGDSWTKISDVNLSQRKIRAMRIAPSDTSVIYITDHSYFYKTSDGGATWTNLTANLPSTSNALTSIEVAYNNPDHIWISFGGFDNINAYESTDGGTTWTNISEGLPNVPANSIIHNSMTVDGDIQLYMGTDLGVFFKEGDRPWEEFRNNLPNVTVSEVEIYYDSTDNQNSKIYACTYGRGLWKSNLASFTQTSIDDEFLAKVGISIYPNPSKGKFFIENTGESIVSKVAVYDVSGKKVYESNLEKSIYTVDLTHVAKGVYVIKLIIDDKKVSSKILIK